MRNYITPAPRREQFRTISLDNFRLGLNTVLPSSKLHPNELSECQNWKFSHSGGLVTRDGLTKYTNTAFANNVKFMTLVPIGSTSYELCVDSNYELFYLDGSKNPVSIGTLEGEATIVPYKGVAILLDGSYIKYYDGSSIKIAYDDGDGDRAYQFNNLSGSEDSTIALGDGTNVRVAYKFTSQSWTSGYTIPPTKIFAKLSKTGSPTGDITINIRKVSDDSIIASKTFIDVSTLGSTAVEYSVTFSSSDITTEMSPSTEYYASLEYSGGDVSNYVNVHCTDVSSNGTAYYYTTTWNADTTKAPIMGLRPGRPPKGAFGVVKLNRLFVAGDPDNPGVVWYSNLTYLDWSTTNGGGWIGVIDDDANNYAVGALAVQYGDLYVFGTEDQPFLSKLEGSSPDEYALPPLFQRVWATHKTTMSVVNDLWFSSSGGTDTLRGVQEYGDLRAFSESDPVMDKIQAYWDSNAFAGYNPADGQYMLKLNGYRKVLVCHTKLPAQHEELQRVRYPWVEYQFTRERLTNTNNYKWTASSTDNEYYVELAGGGDPSLTEPAYLLMDDMQISKGTVGSLSDHTWGYGDNDGLGYNTIYIRDDSGNPNDTDVEITTILEPTAFGAWSNKFFIAMDDGHIYYLDSSEAEDNNERIRYILGTAFITVPFGAVCVQRYSVSASSYLGGQMDVELYIDGTLVNPEVSDTITLSIKDDITVDELGSVTVDEALFTLDPADRLIGYCNARAKSFRVVLRDIIPNGYPIYFKGIYLEVRSLGR